LRRSNKRRNQGTEFPVDNWADPTLFFLGDEGVDQPSSLASARAKRSGNIFAAIIEAQLIIDGGHQVVVLINAQHAQIANDHREPSETTISFLNSHYTTDRIGTLVTEKDASLNATEPNSANTGLFSGSNYASLRRSDSPQRQCQDRKK
jgi:hypothetical protein